MVLGDPQIFTQFGFVLRSMLPQIDRVCVTGLKDGKVVELMGPMAARRGRKPGRDNAGDATAKQCEEQISKHLTNPLESILSPLAEVDAEGESLTEYAKDTKVVVNNDLSKAKGTLIETMVKRGVKSSLHVPVKIKGQLATINFWSTDADAFPCASSGLADWHRPDHGRAERQRSDFGQIV